MALRRRSGQGEGMNVWPGYVDALSTLLMVIIFVLLVFVLAQAFLSVTLSGRDQALDRLNRQLAELSDMLALEKGRSAELRISVSQMGQDLRAALATRDSLTQQLAGLRAEQDRLTADRDTLKADRDRLAARVSDADLQSQGSRARIEQVQAQLADAARAADTAARAAAQTEAQLAEAKRQFVAAQADAAAQRDQSQAQAREAAARADSEAQKRAAAEQQLTAQTALTDAAQARVAELTRQMQELRDQVASVAHALDLAQDAGKSKDTQIAELNGKLNTAMAQRLEELQRYRSDFFGKLREVLSNRPGIQVVGDRFVFQSEVLFPVGSAELTAAGQEQINQLAATLKDIAREIPSGVNWLLRVDGHADRQPISGGAYSSNWELSAGRAITVVKRLIADGIPADRVAAAGFADYQPLDAGDTPDAYAKNRRIEIRLTDR